MGFLREIPFGRLRPTWDIAKRGVCLTRGEKEYWVYLPDGGATEFNRVFSSEWKGEWIEPLPEGATVLFSPEGKKSFAIHPSFRADAVLHVWRNDGQ